MGGVIIGVDLEFLDDVIGSWALTPRGNFLFLPFKTTVQNSASLDPLIGPLAFVVRKLLPKK